jgi:hypothetical protein
MYYLNGEGSSRFEVGVDSALLHDIVPQEGGGCEPLGFSAEEQVGINESQ